MTFDKWLKSYMIDNKIQQKKLMDVSGFHANVIHGWKSGRTKPNGYSLAVLATALSKITGTERPALLEDMAIALLRS